MWYHPARLRILVDYRPALRQRTGVGEYVHHLTGALLLQPAAGLQVTLFSSSWKDRLPPDRLPEAARCDLRIPVRLLNFAWHRLEWPRIESLGLRADVAWSLHPLLLPSRDAARVVTVHDLYFLDHPDDTVREVRRDYAALAAAHARRADAIVTNSDYTRRQAAARFDLPLDRFTVCYPGAPPWPRREEPPAHGPILHVGTVEPRKNVGALLDAYEELLRRVPDAPPLVLAGAAPGTPAALLGGRSPALAGNVRFLGYVSDEERRRLFQDASVLVLPSRDEGFGMPALEAMTVGLPVIAAGRGAFPEVLGDAGLLVDADDRVALSGAIQRVLGDVEVRRHLADRGVRRAAHFSWEASAGRLIHAFSAARARRESRR